MGRIHGNIKAPKTEKRTSQIGSMSAFRNNTKVNARHSARRHQSRYATILLGLRIILGHIPDTVPDGMNQSTQLIPLNNETMDKLKHQGA